VIHHSAGLRAPLCAADVFHERQVKISARFARIRMLNVMARASASLLPPY